MGQQAVDSHYFSEKLKLVIRDLAIYTPSELSLELFRLSLTAKPAESVNTDMLPTLMAETQLYGLAEHVRAKELEVLTIAAECNESNGYHNAFDIDLILDRAKK